MKKITLLMALTGLLSCGNNKNGPDYSLIPVKNGEREMYINTKGETVLTPIDNLTGLGFFYTDRAMATLDGKKGYIDKTGKTVIPCIYTDVTHFSEGLAWVVEPDGFPVAIDVSGKTIIEMPQASIVTNFADGLAIYRDSKSYPYGIIDNQGKELIAPTFKDLIVINSDFIGFETETDLWGVMDINKKILITPTFKGFSPQSTPKRAIVQAPSGQWGVVDRNGEYIVKPLYDNIEPDGDLFLIQTSNDQYGWINAKDQFVINPRYTYAGRFNDSGLAPVSTEKMESRTKNYQMGYINKSGEEKIRPQFESSGSFHDGIAPIMIGDKFGFIDEKGSIIINPQFDNIRLRSKLHLSYSESVRSDYFDFQTLLDNLLDIPKDGVFRGFDQQTTYATLKAKYGDKLERWGYQSCKFYEPVVLSDDASIIETTFNFDKPLQNSSYNYYTHSYDVSSNGDSRLSTIKFKIEMKKNTSKRDALIEKINQQLSTKFKMTENSHYATNHSMKLSPLMGIMASESGSSYIMLEVQFGAKYGD